jgi:hypothetical protein
MVWVEFVAVMQVDRCFDVRRIYSVDRCICRILKRDRTRESRIMLGDLNVFFLQFDVKVNLCF